MSEFVWSAKYSVNNAQIDAEHQRLIELANDLATFAASGKKLPRIKGAIIALYDYVKTHFQHEGIIAEMNAIMKHSGNLDTLVYKFKRLMHGWVLEHILTEDSRIASARKPEETTDQQPSDANGTAVKPE